MNEFGGIFAISCVAVFAPLLVRLPAFAFMPVVGLELVLGVLIGPSAMGLVTNDSTIKFLAELGLVFLFFQAGLESKQNEIGRAELRLGAFAWLATFALAVGFVGVLYLFGMVGSPLLVALILPTTAFGIAIPICGRAANCTAISAGMSWDSRRSASSVHCYWPRSPWRSKSINCIRRS